MRVYKQEITEPKECSSIQDKGNFPKKVQKTNKKNKPKQKQVLCGGNKFNFQKKITEHYDKRKFRVNVCSGKTRKLVPNQRKRGKE